MVDPAPRQAVIAEGGDKGVCTRGEKAQDNVSLEQNNPVSLLVPLIVLLTSSSLEHSEEKLVVLLEELDDEVAGAGFWPMPKRRSMASPTQSLHFCWLPLEWVLFTDFLRMVTGRLMDKKSAVW